MRLPLSSPADETMKKMPESADKHSCRKFLFLIAMGKGDFFCLHPTCPAPRYGKKAAFILDCVFLLGLALLYPEACRRVASMKPMLFVFIYL